MTLRDELMLYLTAKRETTAACPATNMEENVTGDFIYTSDDDAADALDALDT